MMEDSYLYKKTGDEFVYRKEMNMPGAVFSSGEGMERPHSTFLTYGHTIYDARASDLRPVRPALQRYARGVGALQMPPPRNVLGLALAS